MHSNKREATRRTAEEKTHEEKHNNMDDTQNDEHRRKDGGEGLDEEAMLATVWGGQSEMSGLKQNGKVTQSAEKFTIWT